MLSLLSAGGLPGSSSMPSRGDGELGIPFRAHYRPGTAQNLYRPNSKHDRGSRADLLSQRRESFRIALCENRVR
jgi:hypothetical protein